MEQDKQEVPCGPMHSAKGRTSQYKLDWVGPDPDSPRGAKEVPGEQSSPSQWHQYPLSFTMASVT